MNEKSGQFWKPGNDLFWRSWKMSIWLSLLFLLILFSYGQLSGAYSFALGAGLMLVDAYLFRILLEEAWLGKSKYRWLAGFGLVLKYPIIFGIFIYLVRRYPPHWMHGIGLLGGIALLPLVLGAKILSLWLTGRLKNGGT